MEYFELAQSRAVENPLEIVKLDGQQYCQAMREKDFNALDRLKVAYFSGREFEEPCDILIQPTFLVSDQLKKVLELYDRTIRFKGIQLFPTEEGVENYPMYWVPLFQTRECLHEETQKYDNGMLKTLVLDQKKTGGKQILRIGGILEYKVAVSLPVAESILRRHLYGVSLQRIEVR